MLCNVSDNCICVLIEQAAKNKRCFLTLYPLRGTSRKSGGDMSLPAPKVAPPLATLPNSEVIRAPLLHFKPIFDLPLKKVVRGASSPMVGALVRLGDSLARVKIWGRSTP